MNRNFLKNTLLGSLFMLGLALISVSCDEAPKEKKETTEVSSEVEAYQEKFNGLMKETVAVHDEVMPKMGEIKSLISKLGEAELAEEKAEELIGNLKDGHDHMMKWMKEFSSTFDRTEVNEGIAATDIETLDERLTALSQSYEDAIIMKNKINTSIEEASTALSE